MKPGATSSEFWLKVALMVLFVLNGTAYVNIPWEQMPFITAAIGLYSWERFKVKEAAIKNGNGSQRAP